MLGGGGGAVTQTDPQEEVRRVADDLAARQAAHDQNARQLRERELRTKRQEAMARKAEKEKAGRRAGKREREELLASRGKSRDGSEENPAFALFDSALSTTKGVHAVPTTGGKRVARPGAAPPPREIEAARPKLCFLGPEERLRRLAQESTARPAAHADTSRFQGDAQALELLETVRRGPSNLASKEENEALEKALASICIRGAEQWPYAEDVAQTDPERAEEIRQATAARERILGQRAANLPVAAPGQQQQQQQQANDPGSWLDDGSDEEEEEEEAEGAGDQAFVYHFAADVQALLATRRAARDKTLAHHRLTPIHQVCQAQVTERHPARALQEAGLRSFESCMALTNEFEFTPSPTQQQFLAAIFQVCAPHIVGPSNFLALRDILLGRWGVDEPKMAAIVMCPRRWGKTTSTAMAVAIIMYLCRGVNILVFSTGQAMSTTFMKMALKFFLQLPGDPASRVVRRNTKQILVSFAGTDPSRSVNDIVASGQVNTLKALAANVETNRGVTADIFILEEAAAIPQAVLRTIIAPMLKVKNSVLLALSTHQGKDNYYTQFFDKSNSVYSRLFLTLMVELLCEDCKAKGKGNLTKCTHMDHLHPPWLLTGNKERVEVFMGGDKKLYAQEVLGVIMGDADRVFQEDWVVALRGRQRREIPHAEEGLFVVSFLDPAGGGDSKTGICSVVRSNRGGAYVVGLDEIDQNDSVAMGENLKNYFSHFSIHWALKDLPHFICVEVNFGGPTFTSNLVNQCKVGCPRLLEHRYMLDRSGVHTDQNNKASAVLSTGCLLHENRVWMDPNLASLHYMPDNDKDRCFEEGDVLDQLKEQMLALHKKATGSSGKWTYTAKTRSGGRDDMLMALMMAIHYSTVILGLRIEQEAERESELPLL
jgi:hypothetical protein